MRSPTAWLWCEGTSASTRPPLASRSVYRISAPRKALCITSACIGLASSWTMSSGRTSTSTGASAGSCRGTAGCSMPSSTSIRPSPRRCPGISTPCPIKPATKRDAGRWYNSCALPHCSITPSCITPISSAMAKASYWSCVTRMAVVPCAFRIARTSRLRRSRRSTSRLENGSSSSSSSGRGASARASATRCCWPPESSCGYLRPEPASPTSCSTSSTRSARSARPARVRPKPTLAATSRCGNSA